MLLSVREGVNIYLLAIFRSRCFALGFISFLREKNMADKEACNSHVVNQFDSMTEYLRPVVSTIYCCKKNWIVPCQMFKIFHTSDSSELCNCKKKNM